MKASKAKKKLKSKVKARVAKKIAAQVKKAVKKTAKPKSKATQKRETPMAGKKDDDDQANKREARKAGEIDTGTEHVPLKPDGTPYEDGIDPMSTPPAGPLSPSEAARVDQGGEVDLSGSPGSAGEHVPVIEPSREHDPGTTHENRPPREDSDPRETAARTAQTQSQQGGDPKAYRAPGESADERKAREAKEAKDKRDK